MTFIAKFEAIKKKYAKPDLTKLTESLAIQVNLTDEDCGGAFYIAYINDEFAVEPYDYHDHTAMITTDAKTFEGFIGGKNSISDMAIEGNEEHVKAIALIIEKKKAAPKKATVKKTAEKKPAAKKAAEKKPAAKKTTAKKATAKKAEVKAEQITMEEVKANVEKAEAKKAPAKKTTKASGK